MKQRKRIPRQARWAVPTGIVAAIALTSAASSITSASAAPQLPSRTPAQLLAAVADNTSLPLSGTVVETAALGLPALPPVMGTISLPSLLAGSHTIDVWYSDPAHYRLAIPQSMSESDLIRSGRDLWFWGSTTGLVTHETLPSAAGKSAAGQSPGSALPLTPQQVGDQILAKIGPTTTVSATSNVVVAGEAAYQIVVVPKSQGSLIGEIRIAIDARHNVPLRVQVFAKGAASPAFQAGFTSISFAKPAAADLAFRSPAGATVVQNNGGSTADATSGSILADNAKVIGTGWLAVADLPESSLSSAVAGTPPSSSPHSATGPLGGSSSVTTTNGKGMSGLGIGTDAIFNALLQSAKPVSGSWGTGHQLQTGLLSILVTSNGRVFIGAVTPDVLYQAVAHAAQVPAVGQRHASVSEKSR